MKALIQKPLSEFEDDWLYAAYLGFSKLGAQVLTFTDVRTIRIQDIRETVVVAWIEDTDKFFSRLGLSLPKPLNIPTVIEKYCRREIERTTLAEFLNRGQLKKPIFIKPNTKLKLFPAGVITKLETLNFLDTFYHNTGVLISEVVDMVSEYRVFVHKGEIVGIQWYMGDFKIFPEISVIEECINEYQAAKAPIAYTIDFAVTRDGQTVLIECNDAFSIGNYGLEAKTYAKMLRDRWFEIFKDYTI